MTDLLPHSHIHTSFAPFVLHSRHWELVFATAPCLITHVRCSRPVAVTFLKEMIAWNHRALCPPTPSPTSSPSTSASAGPSGVSSSGDLWRDYADLGPPPALAGRWRPCRLSGARDRCPSLGAPAHLVDLESDMDEDERLLWTRQPLDGPASKEWSSRLWGDG